MVVPEYAVVAFPGLDTLNPESLQEFRTAIALQVQGDPAIFDERAPLGSLVLAFAVAHDVATQAILSLTNGRDILLFDHETRDVMAKKSIDDTLWTTVAELKESLPLFHDAMLPPPQFSVHLDTIWNATEESDDIVERTRLFLEALILAFIPCIALQLRGDIPALPLLCAVYLARPTAQTVEYIDASGTTLALFA